MGTVTQLKNGAWFVTWSFELSRLKLSGDVVFTCINTTFTMGFSVLGRKISFYIKHNGSSRYCEETRLMVAAIYNNQLMELNEQPAGQWGPASWDATSTLRLSSTYPVFHVIIDYRKLDQPKPAITHGQQQILNHLSKLLDTETMADVNFIVRGQEVKAHSAIVVSGSPVMAVMFEAGKFKEGLTKTVEIEDIQPSIFRLMLRYLYTGEAPKLELNSQRELLFLAADKYQIDGLKKICEESLVDNLNLRNAVHLLVLADLHYASKLFEGSLKCLKRNKKDIWNRPEWKQLMKKSPDLFFRVSQRIFG